MQVPLEQIVYPYCIALILAFSWRVYLCLANILPKVWICFSFLLGASKCINIITNYGERSWGRDLEEKNETFLLLLVCCYVVPLVARKNPIYDQEWLWDNEVLSLFLFSFRQQSSCVCELQRGELYNNNPQSPWKDWFGLKNHSQNVRRRTNVVALLYIFLVAAVFAFKTCTSMKHAR